MGAFGTVEQAIESPLKWLGGKKRLARVIVPQLPKDAECYCESFGGAGWVLFSKPPHPAECLNDKNAHLANLWRVLKWRKAELLEEVHHHLYSRTEFDSLKHSDPYAMSELDRATWLYLLIQMSFGSDLSSSPSMGYWNKARGALFLSKSLSQFGPAQERLRNVFIECLDFEECIKIYDQPLTIHFCDPPYLGTRGYSEEFSADDHDRLARTLRGIEGRFLLTINDSPETRECYQGPGWVIREARESRGISRATRGRQPAPILMIANYRINPSLMDLMIDDEDDPLWQPEATEEEE